MCTFYLYFFLHVKSLHKKNRFIIVLLTSFTILLLKCDCFSNFIEITLQHGFSPVNLLHILRTPFPKNISRGLLLIIHMPRFTCGKRVIRRALNQTQPGLPTSIHTQPKKGHTHSHPPTLNQKKVTPTHTHPHSTKQRSHLLTPTHNQPGQTHPYSPTPSQEKVIPT